MSETQITPAGWYDDGSGNTRWWDGHQWGGYAPPPVVVNVTQPVRRPANGGAVAGFIIGLFALLLSWVPGLGIFLAAIGIAFSAVGLYLAKVRGGKGLASAGLILSITATFIFVLILILSMQTS